MEVGAERMSVARRRTTRWTFEAPVVYWHGPAPHVFARLPADVADGIHALGPSVSYGWGCVPVSATIGGVDFTTSLIPRDGTFLLPLKVAVRRQLELEEGADVTVEMIVTRGRDSAGLRAQVLTAE